MGNEMKIHAMLDGEELFRQALADAVPTDDKGNPISVDEAIESNTPIDPVRNLKGEICHKVGRMIGHTPTMLDVHLSILTSPDVLPMLKHLIKLVEEETHKE